MVTITRSRARRLASPKRSSPHKSPVKVKETKEESFDKWLHDIAKSSGRGRGMKKRTSSRNPDQKKYFSESEEGEDDNLELDEEEDPETSETESTNENDGDEEDDLRMEYSEEETETTSNFTTEDQTKKRTKSGSARRSRGITETDRKRIHAMITDNKEPAVILNAANYFPGKRRQRVAWAPSEVMHLRMGVERFGLAWADILGCGEYKFHSHRSQVDLKDKWRNLTSYRPYGSHGIRTFILLSEDHQPLLKSTTMKPYRYNNRWPRDAALKAASKSEFYEPGRNTTIIYVREIATDAIKESAIPPLVHVYEGTRRRETAPPHLCDLKIRTVWASDVRKIREERFVSKDDLQKIELAANFVL